MPTFQGMLREREIQALIAFVKAQSDLGGVQPASGHTSIVSTSSGTTPAQNAKP